MAPALDTSVKGQFPNPLPSPVRAIIDAHQKRKAAVRGTAVPALEIMAADSLEVCGEDRTSSGVAADNNGVLEQAIKSTSKLAAPVIQSVPVDLRPDFSILGGGPKNLGRADKTVLAAEVHRLRTELRKAEQVSWWIDGAAELHL